MPRNAVDACILCEQIKCRCGRPAKPVAPRKRRAPAAPVAPPTQAPVPPAPEPVQQVPSTPDPWDDAPVPKEAARAAMKARAARSRATQPARVSDHDPTEDAIRALAPILHRDEVTKYDALIHRRSEVNVRAAIWRQKRSSAS